ncbi:MAG: class I SAM-dependent methyltransferase [Terriglobia bacterium]
MAEAYDATFTNSWIGRTQRDVVLRQVNCAFLPGQRILEINCGTGIDALYMAKLGIDVLACDSSPRMIEVARRRPALSTPEGRVDFRVLATEQLETLVVGEGLAQFDGVLSNFAGLNCVQDLEAVAFQLARLLKPGARALLCIFGNFCIWEVVWYALHGNLSKALRRFRAEGMTTEIASGVTVRVHYPSVAEMERTFRPHFQLKEWKGVGVAVPPSYMEPWAKRFPQILRILAIADRFLARCPGIRATADHWLLTFEQSLDPAVTHDCPL